MRKHMAAMLDKFGPQYVEDWLRVHKRETRWAKNRLARADFNFLDTETTEANAVAEITECAIIARDGSPVFDKLIKPTRPISQLASEKTGITDKDVAGAPPFGEVFDDIQAALLSQPRLVIYNAEFDVRVLRQSAFAAGRGLPDFPRIDDLMKRYARWVGAWEGKRDGYVWYKLAGGHRAAGDCRAAIALMEKMARVEVTMPYTTGRE